MRLAKSLLISLMAVAGLLVMFGGATLAQDLLPERPQLADQQDEGTAIPAPTESAGDALTKEDADSWLDGFMPYALAEGDIAGASVAIVRNGEIVTERGYGYADVASRTPVDPRRTLFRPGSVSKLITWTAVMQQVEAGQDRPRRRRQPVSRFRDSRL